MNTVRVFAVGVVWVWSVAAQQPAAQQPPVQTSAPQAAAPGDAFRDISQTYTIGPNDQLAIRAMDVEELNGSSFRVDSDGTVNLPIVGRIAAGGMTVRQFEAQLTTALKRYVREPQVIVAVTQVVSTPVFFVGPFRSPGIHGLQGQRRLIDMITVAGGLQSNTMRRIRVTRRAAYGPIPLPNAVTDEERKVSTVEITLDSLQDGSSLAENLVLQPYDVITAERAEMVYLSGAVNRVGGLEVGERESLMLTQALAMAGGITRGGSQNKVRVLRPILDTNRRAEIEVDLKRIYEGKANDFPLMPNDHVFVPVSKRSLVTASALPWVLAPLPYLIFQGIR